MKQDKLINIRKPEKGDNFFELWQRANELIDAINDISITILPKDYGYALTQPGRIQFNFNAGKIAQALRALPGGSNPTDGNTDKPGGDKNPGTHRQPQPPDNSYDVFLGTQRCDQSPCAIICYDVADYCPVYDDRVNNNLVATVDIGYLNFPNDGTINTVCFNSGGYHRKIRFYVQRQGSGYYNVACPPPQVCPSAPPAINRGPVYLADFATC